MRGNIAQLMQQAQKMQENLQRAQEELANLEVTGNAGGGMVSAARWSAARYASTRACSRMPRWPKTSSPPRSTMR